MKYNAINILRFLTISLIRKLQKSIEIVKLRFYNLTE